MKRLIVLLSFILLASCKTTVHVEYPYPGPELHGPEFETYAICDRHLLSSTHRSGIRICYDSDLYAPRMVEYVLYDDLIDKTNITKRPSFKRDDRIFDGATTSDYTHSGYDRGHLAPDASFDYSLLVLNETYLMTNIVPMHPSVNRYTWIDLEDYAREKTREFGSLRVLNGVVYGTRKLKGNHAVGVPNSFWKRLRSQDGTFDECYWYDNTAPMANDELSDHLVSCDLI